MKKLILIISCFFLSFCLKAQDKEEIVLTGEYRFEELYNNSKLPWFQSNFIQYNYNPLTVQQLHKYSDTEIRFVVFGGTWCEDTQNLIPRFYKVVTDAGFQEQNYSLYLLNRQKKSPSGQEEGLNILKLPTIIVYRNGQEIGRIIEVVTRNIEADLLDILEMH
jgi:thiol-disulfide isomerase/thioredoxin